MNKKIIFCGIFMVLFASVALASDLGKPAAGEVNSCEGYFCSVSPAIKGTGDLWMPEETFFIGEWVGVRCSDFPEGDHVTVYILKNQGWRDGEPIDGAVESKMITIGQDGMYRGNIWMPSSGDEGFYDIVVDVDENGVYNDGIDVVLSRSSKVMALEVVPEPATLVLMSAGVLSMAGLVLVRKRA